MTKLNEHGTELARMEFSDCRIAIMSDGSVLRNQGVGWKTWKRVKAGGDPVFYAAKASATYNAQPAVFHAYIRALAAACDLAHRAQLNALVDRMPGDPDAVWSLFDDPGYDLQIEDVARCCQARLALEAANRKLAAQVPATLLQPAEVQPTEPAARPTARSIMRSSCPAIAGESLSQ